MGCRGRLCILPWLCPQGEPGQDTKREPPVFDLGSLEAGDQTFPRRGPTGQPPTWFPVRAPPGQAHLCPCTAWHPDHTYLWVEALGTRSGGSPLGATCNTYPHPSCPAPGLGSLHLPDPRPLLGPLVGAPKVLVISSHCKKTEASTAFIALGFEGCKSEMKVLADQRQLSTPSWVSAGVPSLWPHVMERDLWSFSPYKDTDSTMEATLTTLSNLNHLPKAPPSHTSHWGLGLPHVNLREHIQSIVPSDEEKPQRGYSAPMA